MARNVVVEDILGPRGPGNAERAVRVTSANDDQAAAQTLTIASQMTRLLTEMRLTNLLLAQAFNINDDLDALRAALGDE